jgi:hypothetical protein
MNPKVWTSEFMIQDLRYQASSYKNGHYCMERAADRLEELQKNCDELRAKVEELQCELARKTE